jgi:hypothetical protein
MAHTGDTRAILLGNGRATWYSVDEEGDAARFCTGDGDFHDAIKKEYGALNADPSLLTKTMAGISKLELECTR